MMTLLMASAAPTPGTPAGGIPDLAAVLTSVGKLADQLQSVAYLIAFVLLVAGALDGFLKPQIGRFLQHLARLVCLVAVIAAQTPIHNLLEQMADGIAGQTVSLTVQDYASVTKTVGISARLDEAVLQAIIDSKVNPEDHSPQPDGWVAKLQKGMSDLFRLVSGSLFHNVVFAIIFTVLRMCALVVALTDFLQKLVLILLGIWYPIGIAQLSLSGLKSIGAHFISTYVGVHVWPIGMIFVNLVACGLLAGVKPAEPGQVSAMLIMLVYLFPILVWLLVGSVVAPVFAQKLVTHGGSALQAMTGAMVSTTSAVAAGLVTGATRDLARAVTQPGNPAPPGQSRRTGGGGNSGSGGAGATGVAGSLGTPGTGGQAAARPFGLRFSPSPRGALGLALSGVSGVTSRLGSLGEALGAMTSEAGDYGRRTAYAVEDLFKAPRTGGGSSDRARKYLD